MNSKEYNIENNLEWKGASKKRFSVNATVMIMLLFSIRITGKGFHLSRKDRLKRKENGILK
jgi:hypothetical protein